MDPLAQSDLPRQDVVLPADSTEPSEFTWGNVLLGRLLLRTCPCGSKLDSCKGCPLGPLCQCAHGHPYASTLAESRFWLVLALTLGLGLYSALTASLHP